jgi:hypothetical protein
VAVVCALPLPLVAILVTLTPPPHDPAKRNEPNDEDPGAVGHLLTKLVALPTVSPLTLPLTAKAHKNLQQDNDARKNLMHTRQTLSQSSRMGGEGLMGRCLGAAARAAGWLLAPSSGSGSGSS